MTNDEHRSFTFRRSSFFNLQYRMITTKSIELKTRAGYDVQDITSQVSRAVKDSQLKSGIVTIFCTGSTASLTTLEFESGVIADLRQVLDEITPPDRDYRHHQRWHDDNGRSHVRAALMGPSLTVPFVDGQLTLGTWQQIAFCEFDTKPRERQLVVQIIGE